MKYNQFFEVATRKDGTNFVRHTNNAPEYLKEFVQKVHQELECGLPNDWIYNEISNAFDAIEIDELEETPFNPDEYTHQLFEWAKSGWAQYMIQLYNDNIHHSKDMMEQIQNGQWYAADRIFHLVKEFIEENEEEEQEND
jgi:hypothetical protein